MDFDQIEREIFAPILYVKLSVAGFFDVARDVLLDTDRDLSLAHLLGLSDALRRSRGCLRRQLNLLSRMLWMFLSKERQSRCQEKRNRYGDGKACSHRSEG